MDILKLKTEQGKYSLGQIVVPQNFTKTVIKDEKRCPYLDGKFP